MADLEEMWIVPSNAAKRHELTPNLHILFIEFIRSFIHIVVYNIIENRISAHCSIELYRTQNITKAENPQQLAMYNVPENVAIRGYHAPM
jgi:hypothetical protein